MSPNIKLVATLRLLLTGANYAYISDTSKHSQ